MLRVGPAYVANRRRIPQPFRETQRRIVIIPPVAADESPMITQNVRESNPRTERSHTEQQRVEMRLSSVPRRRCRTDGRRDLGRGHAVFVMYD